MDADATTQGELSPAWTTRREAAEYLRLSVDSIDRLLTPWAQAPEPGRLRYRKMVTSRNTAIRILRRDVVALLPEPEPGGPDR